MQQVGLLGLYSDIKPNTLTCCRAALLQSHYKVNMGPLPCGPVTAEWACINNQDSLWNSRGNSCGVKEANKLPSKYLKDSHFGAKLNNWQWSHD